MKLDDIFCLDLHGYMTQLFTIPEMPEGQRFDYLFHNEFEGAKFPIVFRQKKGYGGNKLVDFLNLSSTTFGPVSDRVVDLLRDGGFTGWDTYPIEVFLKDGSRLPGYRGLMVTGGKCDTDISLSEQVDTIGGRGPTATPAPASRGCPSCSTPGTDPTCSGSKATAASTSLGAYATH